MDHPAVTVDTLLARVREARGPLERLVATATESDLSRTTPGGWPIKDQLAHVTAWERAGLAIIRCEPRPAALGLTGEEWAKGTDAINERLRELTAGLAPAEVRARFTGVHGELVTAIRGLSDEDLSRPYADDGETQSLARWILVDTAEHYEEHVALIATALDAGP
jgi:uncharacterized protein (TIGR03083 family)